MKTRKPALVVALAAVVAVLAAMPASAKPIKITSCVPTFIAKSAGKTYIVVNNLTATGDCIDVTAPGITINLNGFTLTGNGTGAGINIAAGKSGVHITGGGVISGFNIGISDSGNSALIENATMGGNATGGLLLSGVDGSVVTETSEQFNSVYGILLMDTTNCLIEGNPAIFSNLDYGIWIQNSSATVTLSSGNVIRGNMTIPAPAGQSQTLGIWVGYNGTVSACPSTAPSTGNLITENGPVLFDTVIGIGLQCNAATYTTVTGNGAFSNGMFDLFDGNPSCGTNSWYGDSFGTANQACVK